MAPCAPVGRSLQLAVQIRSEPPPCHPSSHFYSLSPAAEEPDSDLGKDREQTHPWLSRAEPRPESPPTTATVGLRVRVLHVCFLNPDFALKRRGLRKEKGNGALTEAAANCQTSSPVASACSVLTRPIAWGLFPARRPRREVSEEKGCRRRPRTS